MIQQLRRTEPVTRQSQVQQNLFSPEQMCRGKAQQCVVQYLQLEQPQVVHKGKETEINQETARITSFFVSSGRKTSWLALGKRGGVHMSPGCYRDAGEMFSFGGIASCIAHPSSTLLQAWEGNTAPFHRVLESRDQSSPS